MLDILKIFNFSYRSVPNQGTGDIPRHETKSSHNTGGFLHSSSCTCPYSVHDCNGIWNLSHSPKRITWPAVLQHTKPPKPPWTTVPISWAFTTRMKFPSSNSSKLCLWFWRNLLPITGSTGDEGLHWGCLPPRFWVVWPLQLMPFTKRKVPH